MVLLFIPFIAFEAVFFSFLACYLDSGSGFFFCRGYRTWCLCFSVLFISYRVWVGWSLWDLNFLLAFFKRFSFMSRVWLGIGVCMWVLWCILGLVRCGFGWVALRYLFRGLFLFLGGIKWTKGFLSLRFGSCSCDFLGTRCAFAKR